MNSLTTEPPKDTEPLTIYNQILMYYHQPPVHYHTPSVYYYPPLHSSTNLESPPPQWAYTPQFSPLGPADTPEQNDSLDNIENITFAPPTLLPSPLGHHFGEAAKISEATMPLETKIPTSSSHDYLPSRVY